MKYFHRTAKHTKGNNNIVFLRRNYVKFYLPERVIWKLEQYLTRLEPDSRERTNIIFLLNSYRYFNALFTKWNYQPDFKNWDYTALILKIKADLGQIPVNDETRGIHQNHRNLMLLIHRNQWVREQESMIDVQS